MVETDPSEKKPAGGNIPGEPLPGVPLPMEVVPDRTEKKSEEGDSEEEGSLLSRMTEEERAAAQKEVEREIAALRAAEDAQFAAETAAPPLIEEPEKLVALAPEMKLWVTPDSKSLVMIGVVTLREGPLELFCCRRNSKEYESIVALAVKPVLIHAGLIAIGAKPGKPVQYQPEFVPPSGETIEIRLRWKDTDGKTRECPAQDWVARSGETVDVPQGDGSVKKEPKPMDTHWVFTGSMSYRDEAGLNHYIADETGELVGLSNFVGAILDVPIRSSDMNDDLMFEPYTARIPPLGTAVTLILTPIKEQPPNGK